MMEFKPFAKAVSTQFEKMVKTGLYRSAAMKDALWNTYLDSYPEGTNPIHKERREYDCQACRNFVRHAGGIVTIVDNKLITLWDLDLEGEYGVVCRALQAEIRNNPIGNIFLSKESTAGVQKSLQLLEDKSIYEWNHFFVRFPTSVVRSGITIGPALSEAESTKGVFFRSLEEITMDSIETVLELIDQNSLYKGPEQKFALDEFLKFKKPFDKIKLLEEKHFYAWKHAFSAPASVTRIKNTAIGTMLIDLSEGKDLEASVKSFEAKVAPANYKRPTALITKSMIANAQATIKELGLEEALYRRYATLPDITINNILFADRTAKKEMNVFDELASKVPDKPKNLDKIEEISIQDFIDKVLPKADSLEIMMDGSHTGNLVSLIAPENPNSKNMFKWPNKFSWSYNGDVADSMKERVKAAGGKVEGYLRCSLSWFNTDDLDLHMKEPDDTHIFFGNKQSYASRGHLDVDMNVSGESTTPVENIIYADNLRMKEGEYTLYVNQYTSRNSSETGFDAEIEWNGTTFKFAYPNKMKTGQNVVVAKFSYSKKDGIKILSALDSTQASKTVWNVATNVFHKVNVVMLSPNYWDDVTIGNKHYFFMLEACLNDGKARGFYNEFLTQELDKHRKVFEVVGNKMKTEESDKQLSGLGFSSSQRNSLLCRVKGSFNRVVKITF
jgi:hypothetical protein